MSKQLPNFIGPEICLAISPDLNLVDYGIWRLLQKCVYSESIRDLQEFKQRLVNMWADVRQSVVDEAIEH